MDASRQVRERFGGCAMPSAVKGRINRYWTLFLRSYIPWKQADNKHSTFNKIDPTVLQSNSLTSYLTQYRGVKGGRSS